MEAEPKLFRAIMVSSTFTDLEAHRREVIDAIQRFGFYPNVMEFSGARSDADVIDASLKMVRESAAYLCVIGHKYGQTPVDADRNPKGLSVTELEFNEARRLGLPILLFLMGDDHPVTKGDIEPDPKKQKKLQAFRKQAKRIDPGKPAERVYETFASKEEFAKQAAISVGLEAIRMAHGSELPDRAIRDAIANFIDVKPDARQAELTEAIERFETDYRALQRQLTAIHVSDNLVTSLKAAAEAALAEGDLDKARAAYRQAAEAARNKLAEPVRTAAELKSAEAGAHLLALDWEAADAAWADAETMLAPFDWQAAEGLTENTCLRLGKHGELYGRAGALNAAIVRWRALATSAESRGDEHGAARFRHGLGMTLSIQGTRTGGPEGLRLLNEAVAAYRGAVAVSGPARMPTKWAATQNNLGGALKAKGERIGGPEGLRLLDEAIRAYRDALTVYNRADSPVDWAMTQNNLGNALQTKAQHTSHPEHLRLLDEAVTAYREALTVRTRAEMPVEWAMTQANLGNALRIQGACTAGSEGLRLLDQAITACRDAMTVRTRANRPADWAMTQINLGGALKARGERTGGPEGPRLLDQALTAYREALTVHTCADMPARWAITQENIGLTLESIAEADPDRARRHLLDAEAAIVAALSVFTPEHMAFYYGHATDALARVRANLAALDA
jgi:tetratricopeptide (TPR) repeat protein